MEDVTALWNILIDPDRNEREENRDRVRRRARREARRQEDQVRNMEAPQPADGGLQALLTQLINDRQADQQAAQDARDAANAAAQERNTENRVRAQVSRLNKTDGEDKPKLKRWVKDIAQINVVEAAIAVRVATRTAIGGLADVIEAFLADAANGGRNNVEWPALRTHIENTLLGQNYGRVLRRELAAEKQTVHESVTEYSERYIRKARDAYETPWAPLTEETLIAQFAAGLQSVQIAREITITVPQETLREAINRARSTDMTERALRKDNRTPIAAAAPAEEDEALSENKEKGKKTRNGDDAEADTDALTALTKQVASISSRLGELQKGIKVGDPRRCFNCDKPGHMARDCRAPKMQGQPQQGQPRREMRQCYNCQRIGHISRDCRQPRQQRQQQWGPPPPPPPPQQQQYYHTQPPPQHQQHQQHPQRPQGQVAAAQTHVQGNGW